MSSILGFPLGVDATGVCAFSMCNRFKNFNVVSWNVRGLGDPDKCAIVEDALVSAAPAVICLQETKLHHIDQFQAHSLFVLLALAVVSSPP